MTIFKMSADAKLFNNVSNVISMYVS